MDELIRQAQSEMQDMVMLIASLKSKEVTSRNEISRLQEEISMISSSYAQVKGDLSPLRRRENELIGNTI
jgi:archaellum component FlaC